MLFCIRINELIIARAESIVIQIYTITDLPNEIEKGILQYIFPYPLPLIINSKYDQCQGNCTVSNMEKCPEYPYASERRKHPCHIDDYWKYNFISTFKFFFLFFIESYISI